jgi:hypothetical protein
MSTESTNVDETVYTYSNIYIPDETPASSSWVFPNIPLQPGMNSIRVEAEDIYGRIDVEHSQVWRAVDTEQTFVFAEGATGAFSDTATKLP